VQIKDAQLAEKLGLQKVKNADGQDDLYQVKKVTAEPPALRGPGGAQLRCGTLDSRGNFVPWSDYGLMVGLAGDPEGGERT
jgi:hypothetical protein